MAATSERSPARMRPLTLASITGAACAAFAAAAFAAPSRTVVLADRGDDVSGPLDLTRASLQRASDGRLRAVVTFADKVTPRALLASSGPPGSACLRIWTAAGVDPKATRPDRLACLTARTSTELRGGVYEITGPELPERVASASVRRTASGRSFVVRFAQSTLGRPARIRFAVESTRPGCERPSCIDTVPDKGATRGFRLR